MTPTLMTPTLAVPRRRKLPARAHAVVFPAVLSLLMSGIVTAVATVRALGFMPDLAPRILGAWSISYAIAFPATLLVLPLVRRIVALLVEAP